MVSNVARDYEKFLVVREEEQVKLMNRLFKLELAQDPNLTEPSTDVYKAVARVLGCKREPLPGLFQRAANPTAELDQPKAETVAKLPSIDDPNVKWTPDQKQNVLSSFREVFCPRCYS